MKIANFIVGAAFVAALFSANAGDVTGIRYSSPDRCLLDLRIPEKGGPFPVVVWFHGGGLEHGKRHFVPINGPIVQVAVGYRLFGNGASSGADCIEDAAAAVAWTFRNIASYGGDTNRIFVAGMSAVQEAIRKRFSSLRHFHSYGGCPQTERIGGKSLPTHASGASSSIFG